MFTSDCERLLKIYIFRKAAKGEGKKLIFVVHKNSFSCIFHSLKLLIHSRFLLVCIYPRERKRIVSLSLIYSLDIYQKKKNKCESKLLK